MVMFFSSGMHPHVFRWEKGLLKKYPVGTVDGV
jgi:hypothetical protein